MRKDDLENIVKTLFPNHKYNWQGIGFWQIEASPFCWTKIFIMNCLTIELSFILKVIVPIGKISGGHYMKIGTY